MLYDLLEVRIMGLEMPAVRRMFSSLYMLRLSIYDLKEAVMPVLDIVGPLTKRS